MEMRAESRELDKIYKRRDRYDIPEWQRERVWPPSKKQLLIDTILRGWHLPKFYFVKVSSNPDEYEVVDGQQRLVAIFEFYDNELALSEDSAKEFKAQCYKDLSEHLQDRFGDYKIEYDEIANATDKELKEFFQRLQKGMQLTSSENLNSIHSNLRDFTKRLSRHEFFKNKVAVHDKRYAHFDIVAKVAALEIDGIDGGLRYDDVKAIFESQANFSNRSNVAQRLRTTFDYLDRVFNKKSTLLRNRTIVQSFATLVCRIIQGGKQDGREETIRRFFEHFMEEFSRQIALGQDGTDRDYLQFQKTISANIRTSARIRNEILLRKLLVFDPSLLDCLGSSIVEESQLGNSLVATAGQIGSLIQQRNEEYSREHGEDLFKPTNKTTSVLRSLGQPILSYSQYQEWLDGLYFIFRESLGQRLEGIAPQSFVDVNTLRTAERHDVDHGKASKVAAKKRGIGKAFIKYSGATTPNTLDPEKFVLVQAKLLTALEADIRALKWK
jgi:hypothetical protein